MDRTLAGGKVQKLMLGRVGAREVTLLQVRVPGETVYVLVASGHGAGLVEGSQRDRLRARIVANAGGAGGPSRQQALWRSRFEGASLRSLGLDQATFERSGGVLRVAARGGSLLTWTPPVAVPPPAPPGSRAVVPEQAADASLPPDDATSAASLAEPRDALRERGTDIAEALLRADVGNRRDALRRALTKALARIGRRVEAVQRDLTKIGEAQEAARRAQLFVVEAARAPRGAKELQAIDWSSGAAVAVRWPLDPAKTAQSQIEVAFHRARRMKAAGRLVAERLRAAIVAQETLSAIAAELERPPYAPVEVSGAAAGERASAPATATSAEHAPGPTALAEDDALAPAAWTELESRARAAAPLDFKLASTAAPGSLRDATPARPPKAGADGGLRLPYRTFVGPSKRPILVGRSAEQNDTLTLRVARPHDLWLHAKGWTGAHVIVPLGKGATCPADTLVEAAHLAAHFSDARGESVVEVTYTPRRYVRKPRGSAPGLVVVDREKVIVLRSRADTLRDLLACET